MEFVVVVTPPSIYQDPSSSDCFLKYSSNSSNEKYSKRKRHMKKNKNKCQIKTRFCDPIISVQSLHPSYLHTHEKKGHKIQAR